LPVGLVLVGCLAIVGPAGAAGAGDNQHARPPKLAQAGITGVGEIGVMRRTIQGLYGKPHQPHALKTAGGYKPGLFITEFGYFNRPNSTKTDKNEWHPEQRRYFRYRTALSRANLRGVKAFNIYGLGEIPPDDPTLALDAPTNLGAFDTGMIDTSSSTAFEVEGFRYYGKYDNGNRIPRYDPGPPATGTLRRAYCGIHAWAMNHKLPAVANECDT
jgi:hypothetical protein